MKRKYILAAAIIAAILAAAFLFGGKADAPKPAETVSEPIQTETAAPPAAEKQEEQTQPPAEKTVGEPSKEPQKETAEPIRRESENEKEQKAEAVCTLSVSCRTILSNKERLPKEKSELIPADGTILPETKVNLSEGESVFDITLRTLREHNIHYEFSKTPLYKSAYTEGIGNIYELDCGELSGWMYKVNDSFPGVGCSRYIPKNGDNIEWLYTCDLGKDIGGYFESGGGQKDE